MVLACVRYTRNNVEERVKKHAHTMKAVKLMKPRNLVLEGPTSCKDSVGDMLPTQSGPAQRGDASEDHRPNSIALIVIIGCVREAR